jgi:hypothetical protein
MPRRLYSYVVDHDYGFAPNPFGGLCTLAKCKYGVRKRNIVEMVKPGDWITGTGGADLQKSAGHGKIVFAMRVDEKIPLAAYCEKFNGVRVDARFDFDEEEGERYALVSNHFFYFGRNAIDISEIPDGHLDHPFEKKGPGYRCDFSQAFIDDFTEWLETTFHRGVHGPPCKRVRWVSKPKCPSHVRRRLI